MAGSRADAATGAGRWNDGLILVADIGGTNSRLALARGGKILPGTLTRLANRDFPGPDALLRAHAQRHGAPQAGACLAVAGLVRDGRAEMTNLPWRIDAGELAAQTGLPRIALLNDLQAQGHALSALPGASLRRLLAPAPGSPPPAAGAARLVVGIGTGFNAAAVFETPSGPIVPPAEAGHADLPLRRPDEAAFADFLRRRAGLASVERALSGPGLENIHRFLHPEAPEDAAGIVRALEGGCPAARARALASLRLFAGLLGNAISSLALIHLPGGGIYLTGGVARALAPYLAAAGLEASLRREGPLAGLLREIPLYLVTDDNAALTGCARHLSWEPPFTRR